MRIEADPDTVTKSLGTGCAARSGWAARHLPYALVHPRGKLVARGTEVLGAVPQKRLPLRIGKGAASTTVGRPHKWVSLLKGCPTNSLPYFTPSTSIIEPVAWYGNAIADSPVTAQG